MTQAILALEDGTTYAGIGAGAEGTATGVRGDRCAAAGAAPATRRANAARAKRRTGIRIRAYLRKRAR